MDTIKADIILIRKNASLHISSTGSTIISGKKKKNRFCVSLILKQFLAASPGGKVVKTLPSAAGGCGFDAWSRS